MARLKRMWRYFKVMKWKYLVLLVIIPFAFLLEGSIVILRKISRFFGKYVRKLKNFRDPIKNWSQNFVKDELEELKNNG